MLIYDCPNKWDARKENGTMKIAALTKLMNNYGTNPRIKVIRHASCYSELVYEGSPDNMIEDIANLKVNSFTVLGVGFLEIHTQ